ncbi:MAG: nuclear transport factor 2 family protein [Gemmatimonadales bacterium]|jgi:ketosteroid isomerase-like protein
MRYAIRAMPAISLAAALALAACREEPAAEPTAPSRPSVAPAAAKAPASPRQLAVLAAMEEYKQAILDSDTAALARIWTDNYTFINPQGTLVTREQRLVNIGSGSTDVQIIDDEREVTVRLFGDAAIVQNLSTLHGTFSGQPTDTDLRGTFMWVRRDGRWRLATNQLTAVAP